MYSHGEPPSSSRSESNRVPGVLQLPTSTIVSLETFKSLPLLRVRYKGKWRGAFVSLLEIPVFSIIYLYIYFFYIYINVFSRDQMRSKNAVYRLSKLTNSIGT